MGRSFGPAHSPREQRPLANAMDPGTTLEVDGQGRWAAAGNGSSGALIILEPDFASGKGEGDQVTDSGVGVFIRHGEKGVALVNNAGALNRNAPLAHAANGALDNGSSGDRLIARLDEPHAATAGPVLRRVRAEQLGDKP